MRVLSRLSEWFLKLEIRVPCLASVSAAAGRVTSECVEGEQEARGLKQSRCVSVDRSNAPGEFSRGDFPTAGVTQFTDSPR